MTAFHSFVLFAVRSGIDNVPLQRFLAGSAWFLFRCTFFLALPSATESFLSSVASLKIKFRSDIESPVLSLYKMIALIQAKSKIL